MAPGYHHEVPKETLYNPDTVDLGPTFYPNTCSQQYAAQFEQIRGQIRRKNSPYRPFYGPFMDLLVATVAKAETPQYLFKAFRELTQAQKRPGPVQQA